jgi:hypothetical protein
VTWVKWKLVLVHLEMVLINTQDRCTFCAKHAIGSEVLLGTPEVLGDVRQMEARFGHLEIVLICTQDMVCTKCTIGSEIVLWPPDGTPK